MGTDTQFGKAHGFLLVGDCPLLHIDKELYPAMARMLLRVVNRIGAGKFSCICSGSSHHTPKSRVVRIIISLQVQRCSYGGGYIGLCGILIDELVEQ